MDRWGALGGILPPFIFPGVGTGAVRLVSMYPTSTTKVSNTAQSIKQQIKKIKLIYV